MLTDRVIDKLNVGEAQRYIHELKNLEHVHSAVGIAKDQYIRALLNVFSKNLELTDAQSRYLGALRDLDLVDEEYTEKYETAYTYKTPNEVDDNGNA